MFINFFFYPSDVLLLIFTCIPAAPSSPHVKKTSDDADTHESFDKKNSCHSVAGKNSWIGPGGIKLSNFVDNIIISNIGNRVKP